MGECCDAFRKDRTFSSTLYMPSAAICPYIIREPRIEFDAWPLNPTPHMSAF